MAGGGRGGPPLYPLASGVMRPGTNTVTVRIQNNRNDGGFLGTPESMFVEAGQTRAPLGGNWRYRVERQTNAGALCAKPGDLAAHVAFTAEGGLAGAAGAALPKIAPAAPDVVLRLAVLPGQMQFDTTELTVAPGQLVEVVFTNPDGMQHNFVLGAQGRSTPSARPRMSSRALTERSGAAVRSGLSAGVVLDQTARARSDRDVPVQGPGRRRQVSARLHVPRALEDDERRVECGRARWSGPRRTVTVGSRESAVVGRSRQS